MNAWHLLLLLVVPVCFLFLWLLLLSTRVSVNASFIANRHYYHSRTDPHNTNQAKTNNRCKSTQKILDLLTNCHPTTSGGGNCVIHTFFFGVHGGAVMEVSCAVARFLFSNCGRDSDSLKKQHKNLSTWWQGQLTRSSACHYNCIADTTTKHVNMHFRQNLFSKEMWIHLNKRTHVTFSCVTSCHFLLWVKKFEQQPGPHQSVHQSSTHNTKLCELRNEPIQVRFSQDSGSGRKPSWVLCQV